MYEQNERTPFTLTALFKSRQLSKKVDIGLSITRGSVSLLKRTQKTNM